MYSEGIKILFLAHTSSVPKPVVCWSYVENPIEQQWSQFYRIRRYNLSELLVTASVTNIIGKISFYCTFDWRVTLRGRTNARNSHMESDLKSNLRITSRIKESRVRHEWWIEWIKNMKKISPSISFMTDLSGFRHIVCHIISTQKIESGAWLSIQWRLSCTMMKSSQTLWQFCLSSGIFLRST